MMPGLVGPFSSLLLAGAFALLWHRHRERWLGMWALASAFWTLRYLASSVLGAMGVASADPVVHALALGRNVFLLLGGYALVGRPLPRPWMLLFALDGGLLLWEFAHGIQVVWGARAAPHYLLYALSTLVTGWLILAQRRALGREAVFIASCLAFIGVAVAAFPWIRDVRNADAIVFALVPLAQLCVGFGALMLFYHRVLRERDAANVRLEQALSKALAGYLPICAHCKAIQNEQGGWERLERYFVHRGLTAFSHGICPDCEREHYGDLDLSPTGG